ncbi:MAG TPA: protein phosphatase 2C domain-containing protein [Streptosporangiaceae bacterium]
MQITQATASGPGRANEDYVCSGADWAVILDGATAPAGVDSGCIHGVIWVVRRLTATLAARLVIGDQSSLADLLAAAIKDTVNAHASTCELGNPDSPSATVSIVRARGDALDYLTLGDSPIVIWHQGDSFTPIADDRTSHLPGGRPYTIELVRAHRNKTGGFWVASTNPDAAYQAISGSVPLAQVSEAGLFTDGITRLLDWYGYTWPVIFSSLRSEGPASLIALVRGAEREQPHPYAKQHDDATAAYLRVVE